MDLSSNLTLFSSLSSPLPDLRLNNNQNLIFQTKKGHWTKDEHSKYLNFMQKYYSEIMDSGKTRRTLKIFKLMSKAISTRTSAQCRSHHQKFDPDIKIINFSDDVLENSNFKKNRPLSSDMCLQTDEFMNTPIRLPETRRESFHLQTQSLDKNYSRDRQEIQFDSCSRLLFPVETQSFNSNYSRDRQEIQFDSCSRLLPGETQSFNSNQLHDIQQIYSELISPLFMRGSRDTIWYQEYNHNQQR